jgi:hypothetical protein
VFVCLCVCVFVCVCVCASSFTLLAHTPFTQGAQDRGGRGAESSATREDAHGDRQGGLVSSAVGQV